MNNQPVSITMTRKGDTMHVGTKADLMKKLVEEMMGDIIDGEMITINLMLTEQCNFECAHCFYSSSPTSPKLWMSDNILARVKEQILYLRDHVEHCNININLIGGEPTINLDKFSGTLKIISDWLVIEEIISSIEMTTNGWWLRREEDLKKFFEIVIEHLPEDRLGTDGGFAVRISDDIYHDPFRKGVDPTSALRSVWDELSLGDVEYECEACGAVFDEYQACDCGEDDFSVDISRVEYNGDYYPPDPSEMEHENWIYIQDKKQTSGSRNVIPLGRGEAIGDFDRAKFSNCRNNRLTYHPTGRLGDVCCSGSEFNAGSVEDNPLVLMALAQMYFDTKPSCFGCHENAKEWISDNISEKSELEKIIGEALSEQKEYS